MELLNFILEVAVRAQKGLVELFHLFLIGLHHLCNDASVLPDHSIPGSNISYLCDIDHVLLIIDEWHLANPNSYVHEMVIVSWPIGYTDLALFLNHEFIFDWLFSCFTIVDHFFKFRANIFTK